MEKHEAGSKNNAAAIPVRENRRMAFRLMFLSTLFFLAANAISCKPSPDEGNWFGNILEICLSPLSSRTEYVYEDMYDGTIRRTELQHGGTVCEGPRVYTMSVGYIKKCLQGQVYVSNPLDPDYNTCRGTGGSPDWGAAKYKFCATNDGACETHLGGDDALSAAISSCTGDTTAGRSWYLIDTNSVYDVGDIRIYSPDMLLGNTNLIWSKSSTFSQAGTFYFDSLNGTMKNSLLMSDKITSQYVLCDSK